MLLFNSGSKVVCNQIQLIILLNQLQHLTVEDILDYTIKNKGKMFLNLDLQLFVYIRIKGVVKKAK